jgi:hypothetical protein
MNPTIDTQQPPELPLFNAHTTSDIGVNSLTSLRQSVQQLLERGMLSRKLRVGTGLVQ